MAMKEAINKIDLFLREEYGDTLYIMPITEKSFNDFRDQLSVLLILVKDMREISKKISKKIEEEFNDIQLSIESALNNEFLFFSVKLKNFKHFRDTFRESYMNEKIVSASKSELSDIENIYLNKINEIFNIILE